VNLLLVSPLWTGVRSFFCFGDSSVSGMPAFYNVFIRLLHDDRIDQVHLILLIKGDDQVSVPRGYENKLYLYPVKLYEKLGVIITIFVSVWAGARIIFRHPIDRYIGFGSVSFLTRVFRLFREAPDQRRLFGVSTIAEDIDKVSLVTIVKHPFNYLSIKLPCRNLFITDDGSHGDKIFCRFGSKVTNLVFLKNGVNRSSLQCRPEQNETIIYIGRIYPWKGQKILIDALVQLKQKFQFEPHVRIVGDVQDEDYYIDMKEEMRKAELRNVVFDGGLTAKEVESLMRAARVGFSLYKTSNLGNVLLESMAVGLPVITRNVNGSLNQIPEDCYINLKSYDPGEVAQSLYSSYNNTALLARVSSHSIQYINTKILNWNDRASIEVEAILN